MFSAIMGALLLAAVLAVSIRHMPNWFKAVVIKVPAWLQAGVLHFGYAGWIGGVTGHLMGAPLAIIWFAIWQLWLKEDLTKSVGENQANRKALIKNAVDHVKGWFSHIDVIGAEIKDAVSA
jgi:hypothetical protein